MHCNHLQGALKLAAQAAEAAGVSNCISLHKGWCGDWQLPGSALPSSSSSSSSQQQQHNPLLVVANPPWGLRLLSGARVRSLESACMHAQLPGVKVDKGWVVSTQ
jgi:23S rRNA G2445 N2-methylase RlmL